MNVEHDIGWFDIPMDELVPVGIAKRITHLRTDLDHLWIRHVPIRLIKAIEMRLERLASQVFHDHIVRFAIYVEIMDLDDMRMSKTSHRSCFLFKPVHKVWVYREMWVDELDRNHPA
jgi:hypothetical protein